MDRVSEKGPRSDVMSTPSGRSRAPPHLFGHAEFRTFCLWRASQIQVDHSRCPSWTNSRQIL